LDYRDHSVSFFSQCQLRKEERGLNAALPFHHSILFFNQVSLKLKSYRFIISILWVETVRQMLFVRLYIALTGMNTRGVLNSFRPESSETVVDTPGLIHLERGLLIYWPGSPPAGDESTLWCLHCARLPSYPYCIHIMELCCFWSNLSWVTRVSVRS